MNVNRHELKRRLFLRLKGANENKLFIGPEIVQFHLTNQCNLACRYCWYHSPGSRLHPFQTIHFPFDVFVHVIRDLVDLSVDKVYLSGEGEPTLHPRFYEMLKCLQRKPLSVTIFSNGTFPTQYCRNILSADRIVINLGEADRDAYRALHGKDFFVRVLRNIRELARLKTRYKPDFHIEVVFIANNLNNASYDRTARLVKKLGADKITKKIAEESEHSKGLRLSGYDEKKAPAGEWMPCYHGWFYSAVRLRGDVNVCCSMQRLTLGNVREAFFKEIWQSEHYRRVRLEVLKGDPFRTWHECINCCMAMVNRRIDDQMKQYREIRKRTRPDEIQG